MSPSISSDRWMALRRPEWTCLDTWIMIIVTCETIYWDHPWSAWMLKCKRLFKIPPVAWWVGADTTSPCSRHHQPEAPKVAANLFKAHDCPDKGLGSHMSAPKSEGLLHLTECCNLAGIWVKKGYSLTSCYRQCGEEAAGPPKAVRAPRVLPSRGWFLSRWLD